MPLTCTPGPPFPLGSALIQPTFSPHAYCAWALPGSMFSANAEATANTAAIATATTTLRDSFARIVLLEGKSVKPIVRAQPLLYKASRQWRARVHRTTVI